MTARRYGILLAIAFVTPGVLLYGGLAIIGYSDRLSMLFTDQLFRALREDIVAEDGSEDD